MTQDPGCLHSEWHTLGSWIAFCVFIFPLCCRRLHSLLPRLHSACKQENRKNCPSPPPPLFLRCSPRGAASDPLLAFSFSRAKRCSERLACLHTSTFHRLTRSHSYGWAREGPGGCQPAAPPLLNSPAHAKQVLILPSVAVTKKKRKRRRAAFSCSAGRMCVLGSTHTEQIQSVGPLKGPVQRVTSRFFALIGVCGPWHNQRPLEAVLLGLGTPPPGWRWTMNQKAPVTKKCPSESA